MNEELNTEISQRVLLLNGKGWKMKNNLFNISNLWMEKNTFFVGKNLWLMYEIEN